MPPQELGWKRSDYVISTKLFWGGKGVNDRGLSRKHLIEGILVSCWSCFCVHNQRGVSSKPRPAE